MIQRFTNQGVQLIQEYCEVMAPLAEFLDFLQREDGMLMGYLLATDAWIMRWIKNDYFGTKKHKFL